MTSALAVPNKLQSFVLRDFEYRRVSVCDLSDKTREKRQHEENARGRGFNREIIA